MYSFQEDEADINQTLDFLALSPDTLQSIHAFYFISSGERIVKYCCQIGESLVKEWWKGAKFHL